MKSLSCHSVDITVPFSQLLRPERWVLSSGVGLLRLPPCGSVAGPPRQGPGRKTSSSVATLPYPHLWSEGRGHHRILHPILAAHFRNRAPSDPSSGSRRKEKQETPSGSPLFWKFPYRPARLG